MDSRIEVNGRGKSEILCQLRTEGNHTESRVIVLGKRAITELRGYIDESVYKPISFCLIVVSSRLRERVHIGIVIFIIVWWPSLLIGILRIYIVSGFREVELCLVPKILVEESREPIYGACSRIGEFVHSGKYPLTHLIELGRECPQEVLQENTILSLEYKSGLGFIGKVPQLYRECLCREVLVIDVRKGIHIILPHTIPASISKGGKLVWVEVLLEVIRATEDKEESKAEEDVIDVEVVCSHLPKPLNPLCDEEVVFLLDAQSAEFRLAYAKLGKEVDSILNIGIGLF